MKRISIILAFLLSYLVSWGQNYNVWRSGGGVIIFQGRAVVDSTPQTITISCDSIVPCDGIIPCDAIYSHIHFSDDNNIDEIQYYKHEEILEA